MKKIIYNIILPLILSSCSMTATGYMENVNLYYNNETATTDGFSSTHFTSSCSFLCNVEYKNYPRKYDKLKIDSESAKIILNFGGDSIIKKEYSWDGFWPILPFPIPYWPSTELVNMDKNINFNIHIYPNKDSSEEYKIKGATLINKEKEISPLILRNNDNNSIYLEFPIENIEIAKAKEMNLVLNIEKNGKPLDLISIDLRYERGYFFYWIYMLPFGR